MNLSSFNLKKLAQQRTIRDVVGVELGTPHPQGAPAIRLRKVNGQTELMAVSFIPIPATIPTTAAEANAEVPLWFLPKPFRASHAAIALTHPATFLRQAAGSTETPKTGKDGYRTVSVTTVPDSPPLCAGIPEFQAAWAAKLLPEGYRPAIGSLQVSAAAALNTIIYSPGFQASAGTAMGLAVFAEYTVLGAFHEGKLVLYREHPMGYMHLRKAVHEQTGIEVDLADSILDDMVIDITPAVDPLLRNLFRQMEISSDYLRRRRNCQLNHFFVCGVPAGIKIWNSLFSQLMGTPLSVVDPFHGLAFSPRLGSIAPELMASAPFFMTAAGAARAVLEDV